MDNSLRLSFRATQPHGWRRHAWFGVQVGLAALPFSPLLTGVLWLWASGITGWHYRRQILNQPLTWGFGLLALGLVMSAGLSGEPLTAFLGLFNFLPFFWLLVSLGFLIQTPSQLYRLAWILVLTSLPVVFIGFGELLGGWSAKLTLLGPVVNLVVTGGGNPPGRMASVLSYANPLANYLAVVLMLVLGIWLHTWERWRLQLRQQRLQHPLTLQLGFLTLSGLGIGTALVLTHSRTAWGITILASLAFALYLGWHWLVAAVGLVMGTILWVAFGPPLGRDWLRWVVPTFIWARITDQLYPDRPLATLRSSQWQFAWSMAWKHPWLGWGLRHFSSIYEEQTGYWLGHPHSLALMLLAETGFLTTLLLYSLVGWVLWQGAYYLKDWSGSRGDRLLWFSYLLAFGVCVGFSVVDVTLFDARINLLGWLLLTCIWGRVRSGQPKV